MELRAVIGARRCRVELRGGVWVDIKLRGHVQAMRRVEVECAQSLTGVGSGERRRGGEGGTLNYKLSNLLILKATQN